MTETVTEQKTIKELVKEDQRRKASKKQKEIEETLAKIDADVQRDRRRRVARQRSNNQQGWMDFHSAGMRSCAERYEYHQAEYLRWASQPVPDAHLLKDEHGQAQG